MPTPGEKRSPSGPIAALVVVGVLVLYVLSVGPADRLAHRGVIAVDAAWIVYAPLRWAYQRLPPTAQKPIDWWMDLWRIEPPTHTADGATL